MCDYNIIIIDSFRRIYPGSVNVVSVNITCRSDLVVLELKSELYLKYSVVVYRRYGL